MITLLKKDPSQIIEIGTVPNTTVARSMITTFRKTKVETKLHLAVQLRSQLARLRLRKSKDTSPTQLTRRSSKIVSTHLVIYNSCSDFTNPIKRKEFDRQRKKQQMREMQNVSASDSLISLFVDYRIYAGVVWNKVDEGDEGGNASLP